MHGRRSAGIAALINAGMLVSLPGCVAWDAPTDARDPLPLNSVYALPEQLELHFPYLVLHTDGRFAFVAHPDDAAYEDDYENHGTYQVNGDTLRLTYEAATCCQFVFIDHEPLQIMGPAGDGRYRARFRDQTVALQRIGDIPTP